MFLSNEFVFFLTLVTNTPLWVWAAFAYLLFIGIKATTPRTIFIPKLFIIPLVLTCLKYKVFLNLERATFLYYSITLLLALLIGFFVGKNENIQLTKQKLTIFLPGNFSTLILLLIFFSIKYVFGYLNATNQELYSQIALWEIIISALFSGFFLGKALLYSYYYKKHQ